MLVTATPSLSPVSATLKVGEVVIRVPAIEQVKRVVPWLETMR